MAVEILTPDLASPDAEVYAATAFDQIPVRFRTSNRRVRHFTADGNAFRGPVRIYAYPNKEIVVALRRGAGHRDIKWAEKVIAKLREGYLKTLGWQWNEEQQYFDCVLAYQITDVNSSNDPLFCRGGGDPHTSGEVIDFHDLSDVFYVGTENFFTDHYDAQLWRAFGQPWQVTVSTDNAVGDAEWSTEVVARLASDVAWLEHVADDWNEESAERFRAEREQVTYFNAHRDEWEKPEIEVDELEEPGNLRAGGAR